jgi:hypothetical protein
MTRCKSDFGVRRRNDARNPPVAVTPEKEADNIMFCRYTNATWGRVPVSMLHLGRVLEGVCRWMKRRGVYDRASVRSLAEGICKLQER